METYLERIKNAKTIEELPQISADFLRNTTVDAFSKSYDLICNLCVYKEQILGGANAQELNNCANVLGIPKKYLTKIVGKV